MKSLNRVELVLGGIILFVFTIWSFGKCSSLSKYKQQEPVEQTAPAAQDADQSTKQQHSQLHNQSQQSQLRKQHNPSRQFNRNRHELSLRINRQFMLLVEGLKLRDKPGLSGTKVLGQLPLNTALSFLGEQTDFKDKITIGETHLQRTLD